MSKFLLIFLLIFSISNMGVVNSNAEEGAFAELDIADMDPNILVLNLKQEIDKIHNIKVQNVDLKHDVEHMIHGKKCECEKDSKDCKCPDEMHSNKMNKDDKASKPV